MNNGSEPDAIGTVTAVRGSFLDMRFSVNLPSVHSVLRVGKDGLIVIEVLAQIDTRTVRDIALTPTQGLARSVAV